MGDAMALRGSGTEKRDARVPSVENIQAKVGP